MKKLQVRRLTSKRTKTIIMLLIFLQMAIIGPLNGKAQNNTSSPTTTLTKTIIGSGTKNINGTLVSLIEATWEDSQWVFFKTSLGQGDEIEIQMSYNGDLDLDLWLYIDETSSDNNQKNYARDLTHCGLTDEPTRYSAIKSTNVDENNPEIVRYTNQEFITNRTVYVLIFAQDGTGGSEFKLNSTLPLTIVEKNGLETCWTVQQAWLIFITATIALSVLIIYLAKRSARTPQEKAEIRARKEEKRAKKQKSGKKKKKKQQSAMAARRASTRRR